MSERNIPFSMFEFGSVVIRVCEWTHKPYGEISEWARKYMTELNVMWTNHGTSTYDLAKWLHETYKREANEKYGQFGQNKSVTTGEASPGQSG